MSKKRKKKSSSWIPPSNYKDYFNPSYDDVFKEAHPIGYVFLVILSILSLILPAFLFLFIVGIIYGRDNGWIMLGVLGGFVFGIGLFNFTAIIIRQYLGHLMSILSFVIGGALMFVSWLNCR